MNLELPGHICFISEVVNMFYGRFTYFKVNALYSTMQKWKIPQFQYKQDKFYTIKNSFREQ